MAESTLEQISYSVPMLAKATGLSETTIKDAITAGDLEARYMGRKRVVMKECATDWLKSLPTELINRGGAR